MKVTKLSFENIKSFKGNHEVDFSDKINLLVGPNNSGKSTIINLIHTLQGGKWSPATYGTYTWEYSIQFNKIDLEILARTLGKVQQKMFDPGFKEIFADSKNGMCFKFVDDSIYGFSPLSTTDSLHFILPFLSNRKVITQSNDVSLGKAEQVHGNFYNLPAKVDALANVDAYPIHGIYKQACIDVIGFPISTAAADGGKEPAYMVDGLKHIPLKQMGEGVINMLGLIVDLCVAENKLFLIEEPENDVHPRALKALCNLILETSKKNQFIISTHSNIVLKCLGVDPETKIFHITTKQDEEFPKLRVSSINEVPQTKAARVAILEDLGYEFNDYDHWAGWLFFEESSVEEIVRDYFIKWYTPELKSKLRTYSAKGVDEVESKFKDFNNVFVFIHIENVYKNKAWVVVDGGEHERQIIDKLKEAYVSKNGWEDNRFRQFSKHDFEEYYPAHFKDEVAQILALAKEKRRTPKADLLNSVKVWIKEDEKRAIKEFSKSAAEIVSLLQEIKAEIIN